MPQGSHQPAWHSYFSPDTAGEPRRHCVWFPWPSPFSLRPTAPHPSCTHNCWNKCSSKSSARYSFMLQIELSGWLGLSPPYWSSCRATDQTAWGYQVNLCASLPLVTHTNKVEGNCTERNASHLLEHQLWKPTPWLASTISSFFFPELFAALFSSVPPGLGVWGR